MVDVGLAAGILSPLLSSIATIYFAQASKLVDPLLLSAFTGLLAGSVLLITLHFTKGLPKLHQLRAYAKDLATVTVLRFTLGQLLFAYGLSMTAGIKAIFFSKIEPYFVLLFDWIILKEKPKPRTLGLLAVHLTGAILLSTGGRLEFGTAQLGDFLVILAMLCFGATYLKSARLSKGLGARASNGLSQFLGGSLLLPFAFFLFPSAGFGSSTGWLYFLVYVTLFHIISLTLWFVALKNVKGWIVSALRALGPLAGAPFAFLVFGETLTAVQLVGAAIVLTTSALITREHRHGN